MGTQPAITLEDVSWTTNGTTVLHPISLSFAANRMNVLLGPNGAGKSSLMKLAAGRTRPTSGQVLYGGRNVFGFDPKELALHRGFLSQHVEIDFAITVEEVVLMGRYPHFARAPGSADKRIISEALELVGMADKRRRIYPTLSGGEQQRVQLARVLAQVWSEDTQAEPRILFLDEPIASLDVHHQLQILETARSWLARHCTIIVTLHDLNLAMTYGDRLLLMRDGRLVDVVEDPKALSGELVRKVFDVNSIAYGDEHGRRVLHFYI